MRKTDMTNRVSYEFKIAGIKYEKGENGRSYIVLELKDNSESDGVKILWKLPKNDFNKIFEPIYWNGKEEDRERLFNELKSKLVNFELFINYNAS